MSLSKNYEDIGFKVTVIIDSKVLNKFEMDNGIYHTYWEAHNNIIDLVDKYYDSKHSYEIKIDLVGLEFDTWGYFDTIDTLMNVFHIKR